MQMTQSRFMVLLSSRFPGVESGQRASPFMIALSTRGRHPLGDNGNIMRGGIHEEPGLFKRAFLCRDRIARYEQLPHPPSHRPTDWA